MTHDKSKSVKTGRIQIIQLILLLSSQITNPFEKKKFVLNYKLFYNANKTLIKFFNLYFNLFIKLSYI